jgi:hypothetical protein
MGHQAAPPGFVVPGIVTELKSQLLQQNNNYNYFIINFDSNFQQIYI